MQKIRSKIYAMMCTHSSVQAQAIKQGNNPTRDRMYNITRILYEILYTLFLVIGSHNATKVVGLNSVLVSECIAYLKQSKSLREEGLFRIPGDLNQVKMYHKLFDFCKLKTIQ